MKLKILVLPDSTYPTSHTFLEEVFANILHNKSHEITWIMQNRDKLGENKTVLWKGTKVHITTASPGTSRPGRLMNHVLRCIGKIIAVHKTLKNEDFDIVQVREGIIEGLLAVYIKKRYGTPFSFQYTFPSPEANIYASKKGIARYPFIYYVRGVVSKPILLGIMSMADLVLAVSKQMKQDLMKKGIPREKIMIFPMGINTAILPKETSVKCIREKFKLNILPIIIYVGTMNRSRDLSFLLQVIVKVSKKIPNVKLLIVGDGNDRLRLEEISKSLDIEDNVIFVGQIPRSQVSDFITSANIGVSPIPPISIFKVGSATKIVEYMAMGKPVIGNDIADQKEVINKSGGGICTMYDEREFANAIVGLLRDLKKAKEMGKNGREWVIKNRNYEILTDKLEKKYFEIIKEQKMMNEDGGDVE